MALNLVLFFSRSPPPHSGYTCWMNVLGIFFCHLKKMLLLLDFPVLQLSVGPAHLIVPHLIWLYCNKKVPLFFICRRDFRKVCIYLSRHEAGQINTTFYFIVFWQHQNIFEVERFVIMHVPQFSIEDHLCSTQEVSLPLSSSFSTNTKCKCLQYKSNSWVLL